LQGSEELKRIAQAEWERLKSHQDALEAKKAAEEHAKRSKAEEENRRMLETLNMQVCCCDLLGVTIFSFSQFLSFFFSLRDTD
jgi:hypothetical protein